MRCKWGEDRTRKCAQPEAHVVGLHGLQCELGTLSERAVHKWLMEAEKVEVKKIERIHGLLAAHYPYFWQFLLSFELQSTSSVALVVVITSWTICGLDGCRK